MDACYWHGVGGFVFNSPSSAIRGENHAWPGRLRPPPFAPCTGRPFFFSVLASACGFGTECAGLLLIRHHKPRTLLFPGIAGRRSTVAVAQDQRTKFSCFCMKILLIYPTRAGPFPDVPSRSMPPYSPSSPYSFVRGERREERCERREVSGERREERGERREARGERREARDERREESGCAR